MLRTLGSGKACFCTDHDMHFFAFNPMMCVDALDIEFKIHLTSNTSYMTKALNNKP